MFFAILLPSDDGLLRLDALEAPPRPLRMVRVMLLYQSFESLTLSITFACGFKSISVRQKNVDGQSTVAT